jgi:hypothetical protein
MINIARETKWMAPVSEYRRSFDLARVWIGRTSALRKTTGPAPVCATGL